MRRAVLALAIAGCAEANAPELPPRIDAAPPIDAPPLTIDAPPVANCMSAQTCQGAMSLEAISGDDGNDKRTASGYQSAWYRVRASEDVFGNLTLRASAKVTSPAGTTFGVFIYLNENDDQVECSRTVGTTSTNGNDQIVRAEWGDTGFSSDTRDLSIEVRPMSGACSPSATWQLEIEGNWE